MRRRTGGSDADVRTHAGRGAARGRHCTTVVPVGPAKAVSPVPITCTAAGTLDRGDRAIAPRSTTLGCRCSSASARAACSSVIVTVERHLDSSPPCDLNWCQGSCTRLRGGSAAECSQRRQRDRSAARHAPSGRWTADAGQRTKLAPWLALGWRRRLRPSRSSRGLSAKPRLLLGSIPSSGSQWAARRTRSSLIDTAVTSWTTASTGGAIFPSLGGQPARCCADPPGDRRASSRKEGRTT